MAKNVGFNLIGCSIVAMIFVIGVKATDYTVGDSFGWNVPTNESFYMDWASNKSSIFGDKSFFIGDNLFFNWTGEHTVAVVTELIYENCNTSNTTSTVGPTFRSNGSESLRYNISYPLGRRYFVCTVGNHCSRGQKFSIDVVLFLGNGPPPSAAPALSFGILFASLSSLAVCFFTRIS